MDRYEFRDWCENSDGEFTDRQTESQCRLDHIDVTHDNDTMMVEPRDSGMVAKVEGPADEFFNMGRTQLAKTVDDTELIFQPSPR